VFKQVKQEFNNLLPIAIPAILSQLAQMAMGVIDTVMAGHYTNEALAAIAIGTSLLQPVLVFFLGLFLAFNPIIAHFKGAQSDKKIGSHFRLGMLLAIVFTPVAILLILNAQILLDLLGVDNHVAAIATGYLHATAWGMPGLLLFLALRFCNEGLFSTPAILASTLISIPFNIGFNYWFIYGGFGVREMGAVGVGYATSLVWTMMFIGLLLYTVFTPKYHSLHIFRETFLPLWKEVREVLRLGLPMAVTLGFEITMFAAISLMIARYPTEVMGAHQIALNIASISFMIPLGLSQAITARVGYFAGKGDPEACQRAGYTGIGVSVILSTFSAAAMITLPAVFVAFYSLDPEVTRIAISLLFFAAIFQLSDSLQVASAGALRGLKDSKIPMIVTAISYWLVGFPIGFFLAEYQDYGAAGYWIGMIAGLSTAAVLLLRRWTVLSRTPLSIMEKVTA